MTSPSVLILGIGNLLWADEGFGVRAVEHLHRYYEFPSDVRLMDGGTQGIYLVQYVRAARILVVFDAVDYGLAPGSLKRIEGSGVPAFLGARKMSLHQTGFQEVLAMAALLGGEPEHLLLVGVQPEELEDYGGSLRPVVKAQIGPAVEEALAWLAERGVHARRRSPPLGPEVSLLPAPALDMASYEAGRPAADVACRFGDERFLATTRIDVRPFSLGEEAIRVGLDRLGKA